MKLKNKFLRMSDLANQPERPARTYTTESGCKYPILNTTSS